MYSNLWQEKYPKQGFHFAKFQLTLGLFRYVNTFFVSKMMITQSACLQSLIKSSIEVLTNYSIWEMHSAAQSWETLEKCHWSLVSS